jgi:hypothetical protein
MAMLKRKRALGPWPFALFLLSIGLLVPVRAHDPITTRVTWNREISRIVQARCVSCHSAGGRAPMSLAAYDEARPWAKAIKEEVLTRRMPKWHAARGYGDFSNDPSLSPFEIALISAWADGGAPKGTEIDTPAEPLQKQAVGSGANLPNVRTISIGCGDAPLPRGTLLAIRPKLEAHASIGTAVAFPDGRREIVGYFRNFDPEFATTYWLRVPLDVRRGSRLLAELTEPGTPNGGGCELDLTIQERR